MGMPRTNVESGSAIRESWAELSRARPGLRQRDAAELLGVSEGALVAGRVGDGVCRLRPDWPLLLRALAGLGPVKTITRNTWAVHETVGVYEKVSFIGNIGLVQSEGLDLRLLLDRWKSGFVVSDRTPKGLRHSLQFFDEKGEAVHKIYPEGDVDLPTFTALLSRFACTGEPHAETSAEAAAPPAEAAGGVAEETPGRRPPASVEVEDKTLLRRVEDVPASVREAMISDWSALQDTHDFGAMLARHRLDRATAMALAAGVHTTALGRDRLGDILERFRDATVPVMVFVGNAGAVQIHSGPIGTVKRLGAWMNILDPEFNLHVLEDGIASLWAVNKPTSDGDVHSIEAYATDGSEIAILYGFRKPGRPEAGSWRDAVDGIRRELVAS